MGIRFFVAPKQWASSLPSPLPAIQSARQHQRRRTSVKGGEVIYQSAISTQHLNLIDGEITNGYVTGCIALQGMVKDLDDAENKMNTGIIVEGLPSWIRSVNNLEDILIHYRSIRTSSTLQFNLLKENLDKIEHILADTDSVRVERDILIHIRRLGALKFFNACLPRALIPLAAVSPNVLFTDHLCYSTKECPIKQDNIVVTRGKKEKRKLRRSRSADKLPPNSLNQKRISLSEDILHSRNRTTVARKESELSMAVKDVAILERIRMKLEKEIGQEVNHAMWAEAAGIDQKTLHQRLHLGWSCRDKLIRSTRPLVIFLARNYKGIGITLEDLLQAGSIGVLKGAERFDNSKGYRFSTYVGYWIRKSMLSLVTRHSRGIRLPEAKVKIIKQVQDARKTFRVIEGRFPEDDEIVDLTKLSLANIRFARCSKAVGSIDPWKISKLMEVTADSSVETPFEFAAKQNMKRELSELLESLHPRERQVLLLRYGLDDGRCKSLGEIGSLCNVTKEWIRKIERAALAKIKCSDIQGNFNIYKNTIFSEKLDIN